RITLSIRLRKARALLAYLAMKLDRQAGREELATLLWGDNADAQARHSLRQSLTSLRQDLRFAPDLLLVEGDTVGLRPQTLTVDTHEFVSLARSNTSHDLHRAAELYRGEFLADLTLDIEEFDTWRRQEIDRLQVMLAQVYETIARMSDQSHNGE